MKLSEKITGEIEDHVWFHKLMIQELGRIQEVYFEKLKEKTGIRGRREEDLLFDHVFNSGSEEGFSEYLRKLNQ